MESEKKFLIFCAFLILIVPTVKSMITIGITAEDWDRHGKWIQQYIDGDFSPIDIYPPFYHWFMIPFVLLLGEKIYLLQPISLTLSFFSILWFVRKYHNDFSVTLTALMLSSSVAFLQYAPALMPQALDYILFPIAIFLLLEKRYKLSALIMTFLMGTHMTGIFFLSIMTVYSIMLDRKFLIYLLIVFIAVLPILYTSYIDGMFIKESIWTNRNMEALRFQYWSNSFELFHSFPLWHFFLFSSGIVWVLMPLLIFSMYKLKRFNKYELLYVVWFFCFFPLFYFSIWRWWSYVVIPIVLFESSVISRYIDFYDSRKKNGSPNSH